VILYLKNKNVFRMESYRVKDFEIQIHGDRLVFLGLILKISLHFESIKCTK